MHALVTTTHFTYRLMKLIPKFGGTPYGSPRRPKFLETVFESLYFGFRPGFAFLTAVRFIEDERLPGA
jgi:hypothetical protein